VAVSKKEQDMKATIRVGLCLSLSLLCSSLKGQEPSRPAAVSRTKTYGTDQLNYYRIAASEFTLLGTSSGDAYSDVAYSETIPFQRYSSVAGGRFVASAHLPSGAIVTYFELDSCDEDPANDVYAVLFSTDILGNPISTTTGLSSNDNAIPCGYASADVSAAGIQVDNYRNQLIVLVATESGTVNTRFAGVILGYKLQVSPSPLFADFNDVPTNHPFFQFVEALYSSGITAGCGSGNYCPDAPLTRGQMAVFLSKALGLQWQ
jgi:hypothetical protein